MDQSRFVVEQGLADVGRAYSQTDADFDIVPVLTRPNGSLDLAYLLVDPERLGVRGICGEDENLYREPDEPWWHPGSGHAITDHPDALSCGDRVPAGSVLIGEVEVNGDVRARLSGPDVEGDIR